MEVKIDGLDALFKKLDALDTDINGAIKAGLLEAGEIVAADAKANCPVDTGQLRESISTQLIDDRTVSVGTNVEHGIYVEFGTGPLGDPAVAHTTKKYWRYRGKDGNWVTSHGMPPQPFLRPALRNNVDHIVQAFSAAVRKRLEGRG